MKTAKFVVATVGTEEENADLVFNEFAMLGLLLRGGNMVRGAPLR